MSSTPHFREFKILLPGTQGTLRLLEPQQGTPAELCGKVFDGTYEKPFILETGRERYLHFDLDAAQSAMDLDDPDRLSLNYTRKMMAFLLFNNSPRRILMLGLGGGSLAKFCYRHLPLSALTAVEVDPDVIAFRDAFSVPADDDRFRVVCAEGTRYVAGVGLKKDVILADACDRSGVAPEFGTLEFYRNARRRLSQGGVFVMNLCGDRPDTLSHLDKIRRVFGEFLTLPAPGDGNIIVFAVKEDPLKIRWRDLQERAIELKPRFGLDFPRFVRRMALAWKLRRWNRVSV